MRKKIGIYKSLDALEMPLRNEFNYLFVFVTLVFVLQYS